MVGQFALGLAITAPVILFMTLNLRAVQATDAKRQYRFGDYLALRLVTTTLALVVISGIVYLAAYPLETVLVILLIALAKALESISDVLYGLFMQHEHMDRMAKSMIIKGLLSLTALSLGIYLTNSVVWGVVGMGLAWALVLLGYDIPSGAWVLSRSPQASAGSAPERARRLGWSKLRPRWAMGKLMRLAWLALPLGFVIMLASLQGNIPRYFIEHYLGERELGIYAAMSYVIVAGSMVVNALGQATTPRLARYYSEGNRSKFLQILLKSVGVGVLLGVVGLLAASVAGQEILTLLYSPEYVENTDVFLWLMVVLGLSCVTSFLGYALTAARYLGVQMPLFALSAGAVALACWWLIPAAGLQGAAVALIIGGIVQLCGNLAVVAHAMRIIRNEGA